MFFGLVNGLHPRSIIGTWVRTDLGLVVDAMLLTDVNGDGWPDVVTGEHRGGLFVHQ
ncbi:MAG: hypothetical protein Q7J84_18740 [Sulfuricaulis sp.]|nr:hypothetical protein [Sulfuricaulis sp.]